MIFDKIIAFDHLRQKMILIVNIRTDHLEENYKQALEDLRGLARLAACGEECQSSRGRAAGSFYQ